MNKILLPLLMFVFAYNAQAQNPSYQKEVSIRKAQMLDNIGNGKIVISPNPTKGIANVSNILLHEVREIVVFDVFGNRVKRTFASEQRNTIQLDISRLKTGVYLVKFYDNGGHCLETQKLKHV